MIRLYTPCTRNSHFIVVRKAEIVRVLLQHTKGFSVVHVSGDSGGNVSRTQASVRSDFVR